MPEYLKLPIRFEQFFQKQRLDTCNIKESVLRNLHLLITTGLGENKQDNRYGARYWEHDYDVHMTNDERREEVISSIRNLVSNYEKRLRNVSVEVNVKQAEYLGGNSRQVRRRIEIIISGYTERTNEPVRFQTGFFIGPLSFD